MWWFFWPPAPILKLCRPSRLLMSQLIRINSSMVERLQKRHFSHSGNSIGFWGSVPETGNKDQTCISYYATLVTEGSHDFTLPSSLRNKLHVSQPIGKGKDCHGCAHLVEVCCRLTNEAAVNKAGFDLNELTINHGNSNLSKAKTASLWSTSVDHDLASKRQRS